MKRKRVILTLIVLCALMVFGTPVVFPFDRPQGLPGSAEVVYTIQAGAFENFENARLSYDRVKDMPDARVEQIDGYYVLRLGKFAGPYEGRHLLKKVKAVFKDAFMRKASYVDERVALPGRKTVAEVADSVLLPATPVLTEPLPDPPARETSKEVIPQDNSGNPVAKDEKAPATDEEKGLAAEMDEQWGKAVDIYRSVLAQKSDRIDLWLRIADIEARLGNKEEVIKALKKATELSPRDPEFHYRLSQAYSVAEHPKEALDEISIALKISPKETKYLMAQAKLAGWLGQYELALKSLSQLIDLNPQDDSYLLWLAQVQVWNGQLDRAVRNYRAYLARHREDLKALLELAKTEIWRADFSAAEEVLNHYRSLAGETKDYWKERARLLAAARRPRAAIGVINEKLPLELATDYEVQKSMVIALHYLNNHDQALKALDALERMRPLSRETSDTKRFVKTQLRDFAEGGFQYYNDSDHLSRYNSWLRGGYFLDTQTTLFAGIEHDWLNARVGSGLENIDGNGNASHGRLGAGIRHRLSPSVALEGNIGIARAEGSDLITYRLIAVLQPADGFSIKLTRDYGYYLVSPRTVSLGIRQGYNGIEISWSPDFVYTVDTILSYSTFSDDNASWEAILGPRMAIVRSGRFNIDLGILGLWDGFEKTLNHGYYNPRLYQLYGLRGFVYWKLGDDDGVSAMALVGRQKDNNMNGFRSAMSLDLEGTFGLYRNWMLKVRTGITNNLRQATGTFRAVIASIALTKRF